MENCRNGSVVKWAQHQSTVRAEVAMANRLKLQHNLGPVPATVLGPKPGDFPVGSVLSRAAARGLLANHAAEQAQDDATEFANLTLHEIAIAQDVDPNVARWVIRLARSAEERAEVFGMPLETNEKIRHLEEVAKLAGEISGGHYSHMIMSNPDEAKRIRQLAEEKLKVQSCSSPTRTSTG
jgi:hypothetical protein